MIKDDEDMLKLFEKMPDYLICEDKLDQTAQVLKVDLTALTYILNMDPCPVPILNMIFESCVVPLNSNIINAMLLN